jgi:hypothetical protein
VTAAPGTEGEGHVSERDTRSYTERFGTPPPSPPAAPPPSDASDGRWFFAVIGVGLLVAAIAAAVVLRGGGTPAPDAGTETVAPKVTPSLGPAATPDADDLALQRFWALIADPNLSYHVDTKGGGTVGIADAYTFSESLDVSGDNWGGTERAHGLGVAGIASIVVLDTEVWIKFPDAWHKNIEHDPYFRSRPFMGLDSERDLMISSEVVKDGRTLYDLKATTNYQPYPGRLIGFVSMDTHVDTLEFDILVTEEGVPVQATVHILAGGLGVTGKPELDAKATRTFTKVGDTFTIKAPKP